jgi:hypothetical protein
MNYNSNFIGSYALQLRDVLFVHTLTFDVELI